MWKNGNIKILWIKQKSILLYDNYIIVATSACTRQIIIEKIKYDIILWIFKLKCELCTARKRWSSVDPRFINLKLLRSLFYIKGTVCVISSDSPWKEGNARFFWLVKCLILIISEIASFTQEMRKSLSQRNRK